MIVGLGNPGEAYQRSRHNAGQEVAKRFSQRHCIPLRAKRKLRCRIGLGKVAERNVAVVIPTTFMNRSGEAVACAVAFRGVNPQNLLVIVDDVNLPLGRLRIRSEGSDGGHNGLKSVIAWLGTKDFPRLRIGVGKEPSSSLTDFVLGDFAEDERPIVEQAIERATEALDTIIREGIAPAMNKYNAGPRDTSPAGCGRRRRSFDENLNTQ